MIVPLQIKYMTNHLCDTAQDLKDLDAQYEQRR